MAKLEAVRDGNMKRRPSYFHNPGSGPLLMVTTGQLLDDAAETWPHNDAFIFNPDKQKITFQQLKERVDNLGDGLLKLGLKPGDRLALLGNNSLHWCITYLAAAKTGLVTVLLNTLYAPPELEQMLKLVGARAIITDHKDSTQNYHEKLASIMPEMSNTPHGQPLSCPQLPDLSFVIVETEEKLPGCYRLQDVSISPTDGERIQEAMKKVQPEDPTCIIFTSGTTGSPKAVVISHFGLINNTCSTRKKIKKNTQPSTVCFQTSFFQISGLISGIIGVLIYGNTTVISGPFYDKEYTIDTLKNYKCKFIHGASHIYFDLYYGVQKLLPKSTKLQEACENVTSVVCGGNFFTSEVQRCIKKTFPNAIIINGYGITEICGAITMWAPGDNFDEDMGPIGYPSEHLEVKIVDKDGKMVPFGTPGEALFRTSYSFLGYWNDEDGTNLVKTKDNWFKTGDLMTLREDGFLTILGRKKNMIVRLAEKVSPATVEKVLLQHPDVMIAEVYGVAHKTLGQEVAASIKLKPSATVTEEGLKEHCKGKLATYKHPEYIRFVDEFPLTSTGKVKKYILKEQHEEELKERKIQ